jgi:hypothetical protein
MTLYRAAASLTFPSHFCLVKRDVRDNSLGNKGVHLACAKSIMQGYPGKAVNCSQQNVLEKSGLQYILVSVEGGLHSYFSCQLVPSRSEPVVTGLVVAVAVEDQLTYVSTRIYTKSSTLRDISSASSDAYSTGHKLSTLQLDSTATRC